MKKSLDSFTTQLCSLRFYMHPQLDGGLPQLLKSNELRHFFVRRGVRLGLSRASDLHTLTQLIADNDDNLSRKTLYSEHHILKKTTS